MKKMVLAAVAALSLASGASAASFTYSATFDIGSGATNVITGSFDGDLNGNVITNLSKITAVFNGVAFKGSGSLYGSHYYQNSPSGFVSGGAIASLDGSQNNLMFNDGNYPDPQGSLTNYYYSLTSVDSGGYGDFAETFNSYANNGTSALSNFRATQVDAAAAVPEPASWAMMAGGFGLLGGALRRKKATVSFA